MPAPYVGHVTVVRQAARRLRGLLPGRALAGARGQDRSRGKPRNRFVHVGEQAQRAVFVFDQRGQVYANDGDWVESLTALVEDEDGTLRLLSHMHETIARLAPRPVLSPRARERATWEQAA